MMKLQSLLAAGVFPLLLAGCGGGGNASVSGQVLYGDEPLALVTVAFFYDGGASKTTVTDDEGHYSLMQVPSGHVRIGIVIPTTSMPAPRPHLNVRKDQPPPRETEGDKPELLYDIPLELARKLLDPDASGLDYTIVPGEQTHDIIIPEAP